MYFFEVSKKSFSVIGKEGSTFDGADFIQNLWKEANCHFEEVAPFAKYDNEGNLAGIWGAMSDFSRSFLPWEDHFSKGLYLAGVECMDDAQAPEGWIKWTIPGYLYLVTENVNDAFHKMLEELEKRGQTLVGAVHEYTSPADGKEYLYFPVEKL